MVEITTLELNYLHYLHEKEEIIFPFNGYWTPTSTLYKWFTHLGKRNVVWRFFVIFSYFIMFIITQFCRGVFGIGETLGFFITSWFSICLSSLCQLLEIMSIWVCLPNFSLHLCHLSVFEYIGNSLGTYIKLDIERALTRLSTYTHICDEIDLSKDPLDRVFFKWRNVQHIQF